MIILTETVRALIKRETRRQITFITIRPIIIICAEGRPAAKVRQCDSCRGGWGIYLPVF